MFQIKNMTQMSCNFREQSKIVRMGEKMSQTKPPPDVTPHEVKPKAARISCQTQAPRRAAKDRGEGGVIRGLILT